MRRFPFPAHSSRCLRSSNSSTVGARASIIQKLLKCSSPLRPSSRRRWSGSAHECRRAVPRRSLLPPWGQRSGLRWFGNERGGRPLSAPLILGLMTFCFLFFGYLGVPVAFSLMAGVLIGAIFTDVSHTAIIQKMFDGMDSEALLAIPFFLLVGELMSSANVVQRVANLSLALVGHIRGGLSQVVTVFSMF